MTIELGEPFDPALYITDIETQVELLTDALASGDRAYIAHALGTVARARRDCEAGGGSRITASGPAPRAGAGR